MAQIIPETIKGSYLKALNAEGRWARRFGRERYMNPQPPDSPLGQAWLRGWLHEDERMKDD
tara:strand:+ start:1529 stop:1711 length:183 start_codon:yes stop_codon:yes gene_type:complete